MSILLIGQRNRYYSTQKPKLTDQEDIQEHKRAKRYTQEQYRRELMEQMHQTNDRRRKEKEREKEIDLKYEKVFYDQVENQRRIQTEHSNDGYANKADSQQIGFSYHSVKPQRKHHDIILPPVYKDHQQKKTKFSRLQTEPIYQSFHTKPVERLYSDFNKYEDYPARSDEKMQSVEVRQRKLQEQLQSKLKEVYDLMAHSVKSFNESQELQKIGSKLSPIKLNLDKPYKVRYKLPKPQIYYVEKEDYYKLPNITHSLKQETFTTPVTQSSALNPNYESEAEWREWYARQKLRQLQVKYKKQLDPNASQLQHYRRAVTPKFKTEMNEY